MIYCHRTLTLRSLNLFVPKPRTISLNQSNNGCPSSLLKQYFFQDFSTDSLQGNMNADAQSETLVIDFNGKYACMLTSYTVPMVLYKVYLI